MSDLLRLNYINSLSQPFIATLLGGVEYPVYDIDVQTGTLRIDVVGKLDVIDIAEVNYFTDMENVKHDAETFFSDYRD